MQLNADDTLHLDAGRPLGLLDSVGPGTAAARHVSNTRSSQLFEAPVALPLTLRQQSVISQLDFFKRWYLLCHALYLLGLVLAGTLGFAVLNPRLPWVDAFFIAMSTACNCGLQTVDVGQWNATATAFRHVLMIGGGVVFTSSYQPLLRLLMLRRVRRVFAPNDDDTDSERRLREAKRAAARRLYCTSLICAVSTLLYFAVVNVTIAALLLRFNRSGLTVLEVVYMTVSSFHSCVFLSMERHAEDPAVVGFVTVACALGFTAFPVVLRLFFSAEWRVYQLTRKVLTACRGARSPDDADGDSLLEHVNGDDAFGPGYAGELDNYPGDRWGKGFADILDSPHPGSFHPFLFVSSESAFLGGAWVALTLMQAAPFWFQHWNGLLHGFSVPYRVYLSLCQAAVVRFAAASFVPLAAYSNAHIAVTILAMYLPALPISTDRTYRKWRQMMATSVVRLLTSRLFWLFTAMVSVLFAEEASMTKYLQGTRFDVMTRTFFEVISAYSGCGLSLSLPKSSVSFIGSTGAFAKLVICAVLFGGRHRFVDLGIDLGFAALQSGMTAAGEDSQ